MECRDCSRYDTEMSRCRDGKVNPQSFESSFSVAQHLGIRSLCVFNAYREHLVQSRQPVTKAPESSEKRPPMHAVRRRF